MARKQRPMREGDLQRLRSQLAAAIRKGSGVNVIMPKLTTKQATQSEDLLKRFLEAPSYKPADGLASVSWLIHYKARSGDLPESADVAWTKDLTATVGLTASNQLCYITDNSTTAQLLYSYSANLDNAVGTTLEARFRVTTGDIAAGSGFLMRIDDGAQRFDVYCRSGSLSIDDGVTGPASVDLTDFRWVRMAAKGTNLLVSVDGDRLLIGGPKEASTAELVQWGVTSASLATVQIRDVRALDALL